MNLIRNQSSVNRNNQRIVVMYIKYTLPLLGIHYDALKKSVSYTWVSEAIKSGFRNRQKKKQSYKSFQTSYNIRKLYNCTTTMQIIMCFTKNYFNPLCRNGVLIWCFFGELLAMPYGFVYKYLTIFTAPSVHISHTNHLKSRIILNYNIDYCNSLK